MPTDSNKGRDFFKVCSYSIVIGGNCQGILNELKFIISYCVIVTAQAL